MSTPARDHGPEDEVLGPLTWRALRSAWDHAPVHVGVVTGPHHELIYVNHAVEKLFGTPVIGVPIDQAFPGMDPSALARFDEVRRTGRTMEVDTRQVRVRNVTGGEVTMRYVLSPLGEPGQPPVGIVITALDVTAEARLERSSGRSRLLAELSERMNSRVEPVDALQALTDQLVPEVADVAGVFVTPEGHTQRGPSPPVALTVSTELAGLGPPPPGGGANGSTQWESMLAAGAGFVISVNERTLPALAPNPASQRWLSDARATSLAVVPLVVAGSLTGVLVLVSTGDRAPYGNADLPFLEDVAARAGAAVTHVRTVRHSFQVALELQRALLPAAPPVFPDMDVSALYIAGVTDVEVGGDWWDVIDLGAGRVALGVGDVSGRGVPAAVVMGQARAAMRAAAYAHLSPVETLTILDEQVAHLVGPGANEPMAPPRFATAVYGVFEPTTGELCLGNAGHLPILIRSADGAVQVHELPPGTPLGLSMGGWEEVSVPFRDGSTLAMFTDGLVEARDQDFDDGVAMLSDAFARLGGRPSLDEVSQGLLEEMGRADGHVDDVALLLLRVHAAASPLAHFDTVVHDLQEVSEARRGAEAAVSRAMPDRPEAGDHVNHIVAELVANALQHGHGPATLHVHVTGVRVVVEVTDQSEVRPVLREAQEAAEHGRGLTLTKALSTRWGVRVGGGGKTVWAELLV